MDLLVSAVVFLFLSCHICDANRKYNTVLTVTNGGTTGEWGDPEFCPQGYANGFQMKVRKDVEEAFQEDFILKGIRLQCTDGKTVESKSGSRGKWTALQKCPKGNMVSFSLFNERAEGVIVNAIANLQVLCSDGSKVKKDFVRYIEEGKWSQRCPSGSICGIQTRVAKANEMLSFAELYDVKMFCCD